MRSKASGGKRAPTTRWGKFFEKQMENPKVRETVELELNEYHTKLIAKGLRAAREGKFVSHAEMKRMIAKMGRSK
jgi:predicted transcriptional regulator